MRNDWGTGDGNREPGTGSREPGTGSRREHGFTLPELLIAMTLTLVVTSAALTALQDAARSSEAGAVMTDVNQNLRVAMNMVIRDLLQVGEGTRTGISIPSGTGTLPIVRPGPPGADWSFPETYTVLPAVSMDNNVGEMVNDVQTDVVTLLFEDHRLNISNLAGLVIPDDGSSITFPAVFDIGDAAIGIHEGDLIRFGDGAMQEVTSVSGQTVYFDTTADSNLNQRGAPAGTVLEERLGGHFPSNLDLHRINMVTYYLHVPTSGPITSPHLIRRVNYGEERVVAIGVENVQLTWDLVDGVTNPTNIDEFAADASEGQIRKANLYMAARSLEEFSRTGQYMRTSLTTQVSLRSMAFVSRYDLQ